MGWDGVDTGGNGRSDGEQRSNNSGVQHPAWQADKDYCSFAYSTLAFLRMGISGSDNESPNLHPIFLCERRNDTVQAQVRD
jgi:hypothetical protein